MWQLAVPIALLAGLYTAVVMVFTACLRQLIRQVLELEELLGRTATRVGAAAILLLGIAILDLILEMGIRLIGQSGSLVIVLILGPSIIVAVVHVVRLHARVRDPDSSK